MVVFLRGWKNGQETNVKGNMDMKAVKLKRMMACWIALLFVMLTTQTAQAQKASVTVKDIKVGTVKTPDFKDSRESNKNYWCRLVATFDIAGSKWFNEIEVKWTVAAFNADGKLLVMRESVTYEDVEEGRNHRVCAFLKPSFPRKYQNRSQFDTNNMAICVEILSGGKRLGFGEKRNIKLPDNWVNQTQSGPSVKGQLLPKSKTPFAPMDYDFFEHEKIN